MAEIGDDEPHTASIPYVADDESEQQKEQRMTPGTGLTKGHRHPRVTDRPPIHAQHGRDLKVPCLVGGHVRPAVWTFRFDQPLAYRTRNASASPSPY